MKPDIIRQFNNRLGKVFNVREQYQPHKIDGLNHSAEGMELISIFKVKYKSLFQILLNKFKK